MSESRNAIDRAIAEKERGLLEQGFADPCTDCGAVVFEWWDDCRECETNEETSTEQATLVTDGGQPARPAPEDDPFVCSMCGVAIGEARPGDEYCDDCQRPASEERVRCETCGDRLPRSRATGVDVSPEDEYYPEFIHFCPAHAPESGGEQD